MSVVPFFWIWISLLIQGWWAVRSLHCIHELLLILFICVFRQEAIHHAVLKLYTNVRVSLSGALNTQRQFVN